ncbi:MAG TPA: sigma-70 family RNA polymerase sigma factor [Gemmata sp.]|nr:sigma-70 family RNA polymerase sigma factor [Gemmata sp.]
MTTDITRRAIRTLFKPHTDNSADSDLLTALIDNLDADAFETIVRRYGAMVFGVCQSLLGHRQDAEDAFQATFLVLARKASSIAPRSALANWLYGVARKAALKAREINSRRQRREKPIVGLPEPACSEPDSTSVELRALLDSKLARLPAHYRSVIVLCDLQGFTRKDAARHLGCPEGSVSSRLSRARDILARRLLRRGVALSLISAVIPAQSTLGMSEALVVSTIQAATQVATPCPGIDGMGMIPERVRYLTEGVIRMMTLSFRKMLAAVCLVLGIVSVSAYGLVAGTESPPVVKPIDQPLSGNQAVPKANAGIPGLKDLQGRWTLVSCREKLVAIGIKDRKEERTEYWNQDTTRSQGKISLVIKDTSFSMTQKKKQEEDKRYEGKITFPTSDLRAIDLLVDGTTLKGIYSVQGDVLVLALGDERPTTFSTRSGLSTRVFALARENAEDK